MNAQVEVMDWTLYSEQAPTRSGVYEWRVQSQAVPGLTLIVAAHMRKRWAGYSEALAPVFDYWDGYQVRVLSPVEWRETEDHSDLKEYETKIVRLVGLEPCACIYCGRVPTINAQCRARDGGLVIGPEPWRLNSWQFTCCAWGRTPWLDDPRAIEEKRREAFARCRSGSNA